MIVREISKVEGEARRTVFNIDINFFPPEEYTMEYDIEPMEILNAFSVRFPLTLKKEIANEMKRLDADLRSQIAELGKGKKTSEKESAGDNVDDDGEAPRRKRDDDEESEVGDGDADDDKRARQKNKMHRMRVTKMKVKVKANSVMQRSKLSTPRTRTIWMEVRRKRKEKIHAGGRSRSCGRPIHSTPAPRVIIFVHAISVQL